MNYIRELHKGVQEIFNPFPTIAVWAAVKFVHKKEHDRWVKLATLLENLNDDAIVWLYSM